MGEYVINPVSSRYFITRVKRKYRFVEYDQYSEEDLNVTLRGFNVSINAFLKSIVGELV